MDVDRDESPEEEEGVEEEEEEEEEENDKRKTRRRGKKRKKGSLLPGPMWDWAVKKRTTEDMDVDPKTKDQAEEEEANEGQSCCN